MDLLILLQATDVTHHSLALSKMHQTTLCCAGLLLNKQDNSLISAVYGRHLERLLSPEEMLGIHMLMLLKLVLPVGGRLRLHVWITR